PWAVSSPRTPGAAPKGGTAAGPEVGGWPAPRTPGAPVVRPSGVGRTASLLVETPPTPPATPTVATSGPTFYSGPVVRDPSRPGRPQPQPDPPRSLPPEAGSALTPGPAVAHRVEVALSPSASTAAGSPSAIPAISPVPEVPVARETPAVTETSAPEPASAPDVAAPGSSRPSVMAVRCPAGHLNPPEAARCRQCAQEVAPQEPFPAPRPPLGVLRLPSGDVVTLDRGIVLGRAPRTSLDVPVASRPHVVRVASPQKDVSRTHLEVVLDGWQVLVRDLETTNGTLVTLPGEAPTPLLPDEPRVIAPGTRISLADEVELTYEALP
ncbi:MAG: FHA domain-containing protein, partial [Lapillicoccus sp.]